MSLTHWRRDDPFRALDRPWNRFVDFWGGYDPAETALARHLGLGQHDGDTWSPRADMYDNDKNYVIHAELPGVRREEATVNVEGDTLTVTGETHEESSESRENARIQERRFGRFRRSFPIPGDADLENVSAKFHDGVLDVNIPKVKGTKGSRRSIQIS
ncbi:hypothetical protein IWQ62_004757 [Dispira parvispora]|uniref:SHSP domain-containing protein n=1 Tax=Dispira parvispora TaxID=1520584 RepID=A0A9W8ASA5_9FUNG|nr:hypothetical protein IWQ62_004757 [Dispira parvispora]